VLEGVFRIDTTKEQDGLRLWRFYSFWKHLNGNDAAARPRAEVDVENGKTDHNGQYPSDGPTAWYQDLATGTNYGYCGSSFEIVDNGDGTFTATGKMFTNGGDVPIDGYSLHRMSPGMSFHHPGDFHGADGGLVIREASQGVFNGSVTFPGAHDDTFVARAIQRHGSNEHDCIGVFQLP
jgi:hypothetical protein